MAESEEYVELCRRARDAVYNVLKETEPDSGMALRSAYRDLKRVVVDSSGEAVARREAERERQERLANDQAERVAQRRRWRLLPLERKEALVLEVLGEDRLRRQELTDRYQRLLGPEYCIYDNHVFAIVSKMRDSGQVDVEQDPSSPTRKRYLYFRKRELKGPIAALQHQFDADTRGRGKGDQGAT